MRKIFSIPDSFIKPVRAVELHGAVGDPIERFVTEHFECTDDLNEARIDLQCPQVALICLP